MQQAGIQDSLLCSTATGTAATISTTVSSTDLTAESSFSTLNTDSSLFASPASVLPVVPEDSTGADASSIGDQQPMHQHRYDMALHSINRPNADAISRLLRHFPQQMLMMAQAEASSDDAMLLYKQALAQPETQTALKMVQSEDHDVSDASAVRQLRSAVSTRALEALKQTLRAAR